MFVHGTRPFSDRDVAAYWLPLLALHTRVRLEELGQLRPSDIQQTTYPDADGIHRKNWFIRLMEDAEGNPRLKTAGSERHVPVHPALERFGLIAFMQAAKKAKQHGLLPLLKHDKYGRLTAKWGERFAPYPRTAGGEQGVIDGLASDSPFDSRRLRALTAVRACTSETPKTFASQGSNGEQIIDQRHLSWYVGKVRCVRASDGLAFILGVLDPLAYEHE